MYMLFLALATAVSCVMLSSRVQESVSEVRFNHLSVVLYIKQSWICFSVGLNVYKICIRSFLLGSLHQVLQSGGSSNTTFFLLLLFLTNGARQLGIIR